MISVRKANDRGMTSIDWLKSRHTFSFGDYYDANEQGFSDLRVINEDWVASGAGFPPHAHRDMEIITYVIDGAVQHRDSMGKRFRDPARRRAADERRYRSDAQRVQSVEGRGAASAADLDSAGSPRVSAGLRAEERSGRGKAWASADNRIARWT